MGFRFQRRKKIVPGVTVNFSKSGLGISLGPPGAKLSVGPRGVRATAGVPGTGISTSQRLGKTRASQGVGNPAPDPQRRAELTEQSTGLGWMLVCALAGFVWPVIFIPALGFGLAFYFRSAKRSAWHFNKGLKCWSAGNIDAAGERGTRALTAYADNADAHLLMASLYADHKSNPDMAARHLEVVVRLRPDDLASLGRLAVLAFEMRRFDAAVSLLQSSPILADAAHGESALLVLGLAFIEKEQNQVAIEVFKRGPVRSRTRTDENALEFWYWLGIALFRNGEKAKAKIQLAKVYAQDANYRDFPDIAEEVGLA